MSAITFDAGMGIKTIVEATVAPEFLGHAVFGAHWISTATR